MEEKTNNRGFNNLRFPRSEHDNSTLLHNTEIRKNHFSKTRSDYRDNNFEMLNTLEKENRIK